MATAVPPPKPRNLFGIKDLFTTLNVLAGAAAILLCIEDRPVAAGIAIILGWVADIFDGLVARAMGTANRFGGEYDTIADHLAHIIAPAAIVFTAYKKIDMGLSPRLTWLLAAVMAGAMMVSGSIRHARNVVRPVQFKGIWAGLPRTAVGFLAIGYANSVLLPLTPAGRWLGVVICAVSCWATLTYIPFTSHHMARSLRLFGKLCVTACLVTTFGVLLFAREFVFDTLLFWMLGYSVAAWMGLTPEERLIWKQRVKESKQRGEVPG